MSIDSNLSNQKSYVSVNLVYRLGQITGHYFDIERVNTLLKDISGRASGDPLAQLSLAMHELKLKTIVSVSSLTEAIWNASSQNPLIVWSDSQQKFLIITGASGFKVRLATYEKAEFDHKTISRAKLSRELGLENVNQQIEFAIIESVTPIEEASADTIRRGAEQIFGSGKSSHDNAHHHAGKLTPMRRYLGILKPERRDVFTLLIFSVFAGFLYLALPLAVETIVTNLAFGAQSSPYVKTLIVVAQILTACLILRAFVLAFQYYTAEVIQRRIFVRTASELAFRLPRVRAQSLDGQHGPELVNRFLDVVTVKKNTAFFLLEGINLIAASVIGMILLSFYHPLLLITVLAIFIIILSIIFLLGRGAVNSAIEESMSKYELLAWFQEVAAKPHLFKGAGGYDLAYQRTNLISTKFLMMRRRHFGIVFRQISGLLVLSIIANVTVLIVSTWLVLSQQITLGQLVAAELIIVGIVTSLIKFVKKLEVWYDTMAATDKLGHIFDLETEDTDGEIPDERLRQGISISARKVSFQYSNNEALFSKISFDIAAGEKVAISGPQGCGKSSMLDLFYGLRRPDEGALIFDGLDIRSLDRRHMRESIMLLRRDEFIDGDIIENMRLGRLEISIDEIRQALGKVGILDTLLESPDGLNQLLRVSGFPLSSTQRTNLLFARALVHQPRLLLIDELLDGLDSTNVELLTELILSKEFTCTVVVVTHSQTNLSPHLRNIHIG